MGAGTLRCRSCGHEIVSTAATVRYGSSCPQCLKAFAYEGLTEPSVSPSPATGRDLEKFTLTDLLGKGGMGEVWKAFDNELKRWVALKFLRSETPEELARFQREARTAAALSDPGIAAIYEIGELQGRPYIAMQYIEGRTLAKFPRKDRKLLARLIRDAALALDYAHQQGVIHRDLKPENLIVEKDGLDSRVRILDFGLARHLESGQSLSRSGTVVGTVAYMSPEQARGDRLDVRTDVYSLGATLYEVLTGKPPFEGTTFLEIMKKVENTEPLAPRRLNPRIPLDLETITLKCLEKDRGRRYSTAKELSEDLGRFLDGEAVLARRQSVLYRLRMKMAKRKAMVATAAGAFLVVAAVLGWWLFVGSPETARAQLMTDAMKLWAEARGEAMAGVNPPAIVRKARTAREAFERVIRAREDAGSHVMRGKCFLLEGDYEEALKSADRAHQLDPGHDESKRELAKLLLSKYQTSRGFPAMSTLRNTLHIQDFAPETEKQRQWRVRGEKLLEGLNAAHHKGLLPGLLAMGRGEFREAATELASYSDAERWDVVTLRLEGYCLYLSGNYKGAQATFDRVLSRILRPCDFEWRGNAKGLQGLYEEAIADHSKAIELDPSHAHAYTHRGTIKYEKGLLDEAIADYSKAIELDPNESAAYTNRGIAYSDKELHEMAIADHSKAIELNPSMVSARVCRGNALSRQGQFERAVADYSKAAEIDSKMLAIYTGRAFAQVALGRYDEGISDYSRAIELDPTHAGAYYNRADARVRKGLVDPAILDYSKVIELDPKDGRAYANRGMLKSKKGLRREAIEDHSKAIDLNPKDDIAFYNRGIDYSETGRIREGIEDFTKAIELNPRYDVAYYNRGLAKSKVKLIDEAIDDYSKAIELNPNDARFHRNRGSARVEKGLVDDAIADYSRAIELEPTNPTSYYNRGNVLARKKQFAEAIADYSKAIELNPKNAGAYFNRGLSKAGLNLLDEAIADYSSAIERDPKHAGAFNSRGLAKSNKGQQEEAIADYSKAIEINPKNAAAYTNRGIARSHVGRYAEATEDFERALQEAPAAWPNRSDVEKRLADAQAKSLLQKAK